MRFHPNPSKDKATINSIKESLGAIAAMTPAANKITPPAILIVVLPILVGVMGRFAHSIGIPELAGPF
ncbi:hypothetical protein ACT453_56300, partial [Bacillus sp. D-CC]